MTQLKVGDRVFYKYGGTEPHTGTVMGFTGHIDNILIRWDDEGFDRWVCDSELGLLPSDTDHKEQKKDCRVWCPECGRFLRQVQMRAGMMYDCMFCNYQNYVMDQPKQESEYDCILCGESIDNDPEGHWDNELGGPVCGDCRDNPDILRERASDMMGAVRGY